MATRSQKKPALVRFRGEAWRVLLNHTLLTDPGMERGTTHVFFNLLMRRTIPMPFAVRRGTVPPQTSRLALLSHIPQKPVLPIARYAGTFSDPLPRVSFST
jgi:hypothetical protein